MHEEGDIADGPNGAQMIFRGGMWVPLTASPQPMTLGTPDPKVAIDLDAARQRGIDAAANSPLDRAIKTEQLNNLRNPRAGPPAGYRYKGNGDLELIPGGPAKTGAAGQTKAGQLDALVQQVKDTEALFKAGPGATHGLAGLADFVPGRFSDTNAAFDAAGAGLADQAMAAFRVPGIGSQSDSDAARLAAAVQPFASNRDSQTQQQFRQIKQRIDATRKAAGLPAAQWTGDTPVDPASLDNGGDHYQAAAATGATRRVPIAGANAMVDAGVRSGQSLTDLNAELVAKGYAPIEADNAPNYASAIKYRQSHPGYKGSYSNATREVPTTDLQRAGASAPAAFLGSAFNGALAGLPALATGGDQLRASESAHGTASTLGSIAGGVVGAGAMEAGLGAAGARAGLGMFGRALASPRTADGLYSGISGAASADPGSRVQGALLGTIAGVGGGMGSRAVAGGIGRAARGVQDESVRYLADRGVPMTMGQVVSNSGLLGRAAKGIEDRLTSIPVVGDMINARRRDGFQAFNRAAFDEGLAPIGATTNGQVREQGVEAAQQEVSNGFGRALDGRTIVPDAQGSAEWNAARGRGGSTPTYGPDFNTIYGDEIQPILAGGSSITGRQFQDLDRTLGGYQRQYGTIATGTASIPPAPMARRVSQAFGDMQTAMDGVVGRNAPDIRPAYDAARQSYRNVEVLRDAVDRGRTGTRVGDAGLFAPSQLADAGAANAKRFGNSQGTTRQPFFELSRAGQRVLPSAIADSGTAGRYITAGVLGSAGVGGGLATGDAQTGAGITGTGLGLGALLALGGTRGGQRALTAAMLNRPAVLQRLGTGLVNRRALGGMFGAGAAYPLLTAQP